MSLTRSLNDILKPHSAEDIRELAAEVSQRREREKDRERDQLRQERADVEREWQEGVQPLRAALKAADADVERAQTALDEARRRRAAERCKLREFELGMGTRRDKLASAIERLASRDLLPVWSAVAEARARVQRSRGRNPSPVEWARLDRDTTEIQRIETELREMEVADSIQAAARAKVLTRTLQRIGV